MYNMILYIYIYISLYILYYIALTHVLLCQMVLSLAILKIADS